MSDDPIFHSVAYGWQAVKCRSVFQARCIIIFDVPYDCLTSSVIILLLHSRYLIRRLNSGVSCRLTKFESAIQWFTMPQFSSPLEIKLFLGIIILPFIIVMLICFGCRQTSDNNPYRSWKMITFMICASLSESMAFACTNLRVPFQTSHFTLLMPTIDSFHLRATSVCRVVQCPSNFISLSLALHSCIPLLFACC